MSFGYLAPRLGQYEQENSAGARGPLGAGAALAPHRSLGYNVPRRATGWASRPPRGEHGA